MFLSSFQMNRARLSRLFRVPSRSCGYCGRAEDVRGCCYSEIRQNETLQKTEFEPQVSAVFRSVSIEICANSIDPKRPGLMLLSES